MASCFHRAGREQQAEGSWQGKRQGFHAAHAIPTCSALQSILVNSSGAFAERRVESVSRRSAAVGQHSFGFFDVRAEWGLHHGLFFRCLGSTRGVVDAATETRRASHDAEGDGDKQGGDDDGGKVCFHEGFMLPLPIVRCNLSLPTVYELGGGALVRPAKACPRVAANVTHALAALGAPVIAACGESINPMLPRKPVEQETKKTMATMMMGARYTLIVSPC